MADDGATTVVAIDGPAGSGKSTIAKRLADAIGYEYLDTGAMYRAVTFAVLRDQLDPEAGEDVAELAAATEIDLRSDGMVYVDGVDATEAIRGQAVSQTVSAVAANPMVRSALVAQQRAWTRQRGGGVLEGRDIGTVVFPDADLKVYLTARVEVRAQRRSLEVSDLSYETVAADLARRDSYDSQRTHDPLRQADDAIEVDTSDLTIDEVVNVIATELRKRQ